MRTARHRAARGNSKPRTVAGCVAVLLCLAVTTSSPVVAGPTTHDAALPSGAGHVGLSTAAEPVRLGTGEQRGATVRPNIVLVMTDDQNRDEMRWMPETTRLLGGHGVTFSRALSPAPLCCPARAMTVTGEYGQNNGVHDNFGQYGGFQALVDKQNTLAAWLQDAGYQTALVGKYLNGYEGTNTPPQRGWTVWNPSVGNIYSYYGTVFLGDRGRRVVPPGIVTTYIARRTNDLVRQFSATHKPFFIWASHVPPHGAYAGTSDSGLIQWAPPMSTSSNADELVDVPLPSLSKPSFNAYGEGPDPYPTVSMRSDQVARARAVFTGRLQSLQDVDDAVGSLVRVLRRTGELRDTYIIFVSDNGMLLGEHRMVTKNVLYREAMEVPLVVRVPGDAEGTVSRLPATIVDLAPTILELAGVEPGRTIDGQSFAPVLHGHREAWRNTQLIQTGSIRATGPQPGWDFRGVWTHRYTYMRRALDGSEYLYDRRTDPYEMVDLASEPRFQPVLEALRERHDRLIGCGGAACDRDFPPLPPPLPG